MKKLGDFKNNEINCSKIYGEALVPVETGAGVVQGMAYDSDAFFDSDHDGKWGRGETISFYKHLDIGETGRL